MLAEDFLELKNLTIKGKLSFDDSQGPVRFMGFTLQHLKSHDSTFSKALSELPW